MNLGRLQVGFRRFLLRFRKNESGQIAILFALCAMCLVAAIGAGLDLSRAFVSRQELSNAATLTCQYSTRPPIVAIVYNGGNGQANYLATVNAYARSFLTSQNFQFTQTNAAPFAYTPGGSSNVNLAASVPTIFMGIFGVNSLPVSATVACNNGQVEPSETQTTLVFNESFESAACTGTCWGAFAPSGAINTYSATASSSFPSKAGYVGISNTQWAVMGYCLEVDSVGIIMSSVPDGTHSAELDCDNGSGSKGNSSISNKSYYAAGTYELRYNYAGRIGYPNYSPTYICGSSANDVAWANDTNASTGTALRTNQINVYFDADNNGSPGLHTTIDGTQQLAGVNLIDMCVYSSSWIQRSVKITVTTPGYYWTSFAADGTNDSYGGQIDNIQVCRTSCSGSVTDNFPSGWSAKTLFEDTFENPVYTQDPYTTSAHAKGGNLAGSYGTSGASSGWPAQSASGWAVAPYNEVNFWMQGSAQGKQYISLQGWNGFSNSSDPINRSISRGFLLDPGYYSVSYNYTSLVDFSYDFIYGTSCTAGPTSALSYSAYGIKHGREYPDTNSGTLYSQYLSTNYMNVYMAHSQLVSTPNVNATLGGAPTYNNPDGSITSSPTVPLDNGSNYSAYSSSAPNPVIDSCTYSGAYVWTTRTVYVKITKPGWYWLAFSALGNPLTGTGAGPAVDDVRLVGVSSLYGSGPSAYVTLPTPGPAPGATISYSGFSIIADPNTP